MSRKQCGGDAQAEGGAHHVSESKHSRDDKRVLHVPFRSPKRMAVACPLPSPTLSHLTQKLDSLLQRPKKRKG